MTLDNIREDINKFSDTGARTIGRYRSKDYW
jgi:hypothetical protein